MDFTQNKIVKNYNAIKAVGVIKVLRRISKNRFPILLDKALFQKVFGFTKSGAFVTERLSKGIVMEYDINTVVGRHLFSDGFFEEKEVLFFEQKYEKNTNGVILDIGSNIGFHAIRWAKAYPLINIFAVEPSPSTRIALEKNIYLNGLGDRVFPFGIAISDTEGSSFFYECEDNAFSSLKDTGRVKISQKIQVRTITVDAFVKENNIKNVILIKIDVEGFESQVVAGAKKLLQSQKPDLFVEIYSGNGSNLEPEGVIRQLFEFGYDAYVFNDNRLVKWEKHDDRYYNYYFTKNKNIINDYKIN